MRTALSVTAAAVPAARRSVAMSVACAVCVAVFTSCTGSSAPAQTASPATSPTATASTGPTVSTSVPTAPPSTSRGTPSAPPTGTAAAQKITCQRTLPSYPLLRPGDKGPAVAALQCLLNDAKLGPVVVDGSYGPQTRAAVLKAASATEGAVDTSGRIEPSRWVQIIGSTLSGKRLQRGSHGADVTTLQRTLRAQGCTIAVDGSFGAQTEAVLKRFQTADAEPADGILHDGTRFILGMGGLTTFHCS